MHDVIPSTDRELVDLLANLGAHLASDAARFGLNAADAAAIASDAAGLRQLVLDQQDKLNSARAATAAKNAARVAIVGRTRAVIRRLKSHASYTVTIGEQYGIIAPSARTLSPLSSAVQTLQPELRSGIGVHGEVNIAFVKHGHTGILLYGRRAEEVEWELLCTRLRSPWVDERPNLAAGKPETRQYRAVYIDGDDPVGQFSDTLNVTVPGISFAVTQPALEPAVAEMRGQ